MTCCNQWWSMISLSVAILASWDYLGTATGFAKLELKLVSDAANAPNCSGNCGNRNKHQKSSEAVSDGLEVPSFDAHASIIISDCLIPHRVVHMQMQYNINKYNIHKSSQHSIYLLNHLLSQIAHLSFITEGMGLIFCSYGLASSFSSGSGELWGSCAGQKEVLMFVGTSQGTLFPKKFPLFPGCIRGPWQLTEVVPTSLHKDRFIQLASRNISNRFLLKIGSNRFCHHFAIAKLCKPPLVSSADRLDWSEACWETTLCFCVSWQRHGHRQESTDINGFLLFFCKS